MSRTANHTLYRESLMYGVVKAGAKYGLGGITNQIIAENSGQAEPYIYRYFIDRDDLIQKAFIKCDENFFGEATVQADALRDRSCSAKERFYCLMNAMWDYSLRDLDYCKFYVRYYYSNANDEKLRNEHKTICTKFYGHIRDFFTDDIDADFIMHQLFSAFLYNVMDIAIAFAPDTKENRERIFGILYGIIEPYLKSRYENS